MGSTSSPWLVTCCPTDIPCRCLCPCVCWCVAVLQAKQDMEQVKQMASGAVSKLSSMAGRFMNDLSRY